MLRNHELSIDQPERGLFWGWRARHKLLSVDPPEVAKLLHTRDVQLQLHCKQTPENKTKVKKSSSHTGHILCGHFTMKTSSKFACNGVVIEHPEYGEVLQLQGDQWTKVCVWLSSPNFCPLIPLKLQNFSILGMFNYNSIASKLLKIRQNPH